MKKLIFVVGARPNFMKVAPVLRALDRRNHLPWRPWLVHTGQHYSERMSGVFFAELGLPAPDIHLGVGSGTHGAQTARVLESFEKHLLELNGSAAGAVVVGDVNSTLACALAATKLRIPVAHIEAGLRSFDRSMPEEINRVATDAISDLLLVSEPAGESNLRNEGVPAERVKYVGNVMIDTLCWELERARNLNMRRELGLNGRYALVTMHRPGNVDDPQRLTQIVEFLNKTSERLPLVFPIHPRSRARMAEWSLDTSLAENSAIRLIEPLGYRENLSLMTDATLVITDSGGLQEETTFLGVPCLTVRPNTERPVTVSQGTNTVVDGDFDLALNLIESILAGSYKSGSPVPGWDGKAAERVADVLIDEWRN
ncbi:MAG: UDP-N-acetylglucosamine 2-epimerase (non-hydrolyzing) [Candidatus Solibacter sp.]|jgi:UDP-N-acetylglucosamine 2-epimerase (non-hydrolysing)